MADSMKGYTWVLNPNRALGVSEYNARRMEKLSGKLVSRLKKQMPKDKRKQKYNYPVDAYGKWHQRRYYIIVKYACPGKNAISPFFEAKLARLNCIGNDRFNLFARRYNDEWISILEDCTLPMCFKEIETNDWFHIM